MKDLMISKEVTMTLKDITDLLGVRHNNAIRILEELITDQEFGMTTQIEYSYPMPNGGSKVITTYELTKRQSIAVASRLNTKYLMRLIDRLAELESTLAKEAKAWKESRSLTRECYKEMCSTLAEHRSTCGKETKVFHYSNEAKMINQIVLGVNKVSRDNQPEYILSKIDNLSRTNISLMNAGFSYKERKDILSRSLPKTKQLKVNRILLED